MKHELLTYECAKSDLGLLSRREKKRLIDSMAPIGRRTFLFLNMGFRRKKEFSFADRLQNKHNTGSFLLVILSSRQRDLNVNFVSVRTFKYYIMCERNVGTLPDIFRVLKRQSTYVDFHTSALRVFF